MEMNVGADEGRGKWKCWKIVLKRGKYVFKVLSAEERGEEGVFRVLSAGK